MSQRSLQIGARRVDLDTGEVDGIGVLRPLERALLRYAGLLGPPELRYGVSARSRPRRPPRPESGDP